MPKIKINEHRSYPFSTDLKVRVSDLNYGAHLGYDRILGLVHQARVEMFDGMGVSETDLGDGRTGLVAADLVVVYQGEAFVNDVLEIAILPVEVGPISFRLAHRVRMKKNGKSVALMEIGFVAFNYEKHCMAKLPDGFKNGLVSMGADG
jgi:acyl-CoA thioester hydrolase